MKRIGLLSDTHAFLDAKVFQYFAECDEIWHAGDIGSVEVADRLADFKPLVAVSGNIDGHVIRRMFPVFQRFMCEEVDVFLTHIGGYPDNYAYEVREYIKKNPPKLFVCGHSHILKVQYDQKLQLLHINPGAAGKSGFQQVRTLVRFTVDGEKIKDLEVINLPLSETVL